jgi:hypothetical protein
MDYSPFSLVQNYVKLYRHFNGILRILTFKLEQMLRVGFDPNNGYLFGFSFGAQLVLRAARRFGDQRFKEVDGESSKNDFFLPIVYHTLNFSL